MRFLPNGLNIPDELLEARDQGNVVFLCGAGVSYAAGMPDFQGLARYVVEELGAPQDAPSRKMLSMWDDEKIPTDARPSLDQIFNLLQQEYAASEIDYLIAKRLRTKPDVNVNAHKTILRLSKGADHEPQIVTTNFDLLFERAADRNLKTDTSPALPDLANGKPLNGLVYLHGRINSSIKRGEGRQGFIVSSSDFGRAYLAEGWATRFIRDLLDQYTVVLLGYSANDPPVRYLLQGLHTRRRGNRARLFAFDSGTEVEVQPRWRDSGVRVLAYPVTDVAHSALWDTLSAWADRADDPEAWRERIVDLAKKGPRDLAAYERGQVASLIRTNTGSKRFANSNPPPPGEWLCVFDHYVRYGSVGTSFDESSPPFDPFTNYRLDDDPPRPAEDLRFNGSPPGDDLLASTATEHHPDQRTRLSGTGLECIGHLSPRMFHLAQWIGSVVHQPVVPWWVARYDRLHPFLLDEIRRRVDQDELPTAAKRTWQILLEKFHTTSDDQDRHWHNMCSRIKAEGWKNIVIREFDRKATPYVRTERPFGVASSRPPDEEWPQLRLSDISQFEVAFPGHDTERPEIPDAVLPKIYRIVRRHLELAAGFLEDIGIPYLKTETFYPEDKPGQTYLTEESEYLLWFRGLYDRLVKSYPELARADSALWPKDEPFFFNKIHLYAWSFHELFSGRQVADGLLSLSDDSFWNHGYRRELLHLLRRRWIDIPSEKQELLEQRIVNGPKRHHSEPEEDYKRFRSITSAIILGWLSGQGCELCEETLEILPRLRGADPSWCPEWDEMADDSLSGRGGVVNVDPDPSKIIGAPASQIVELAKKHTRRPIGELTEYKPFDGLVAERPLRAVTALAQEAKRGEFPLEFWRSAIDVWPQDVRFRLTCLFAARIARLPSETIVELKYQVFHWLSDHFPNLAAQDQPRALNLLDALLDKLFERGPEATESGQGDTFVGGVRQNHSRRTVGYALNSPVGTVTQLLLDLLNSKNPGKGSSIQPEIKSRLETLITAPGEGADHAVCLLASDFLWLEHIDRKWAHSTILPWFQLDHPRSEPAWNGLLYDSKPKPELFLLIKPDFMDTVLHATSSNWDDQSLHRLHEYLVLGCFWHKESDAYITFEETREVLQKTNDVGRVNALDSFGRLVGGKQHVWNGFGKRFIENAWPRELRFQTAETSRQFVNLAEEAGDFFPDVVGTTLPFLVPIEKYWSIYGLIASIKRRPRRFPQRFPEATLSLIDKLVPENPLEKPYALDAALEMIAEAKPRLRRDERWLRLKNITLDD